MNIFILTVLLVGLFAAAFPSLLRWWMTNQIHQAMTLKDYERANRLIQSFPARLIPAGQRVQTQIQIAYQQKDHDKIKEIIQPLGTNHKEIIRTLYSVYLEQDNAEMASFLLMKMRGMMPTDEIEKEEIFYRVLMEKKSEDIDRVMELHQICEDPLQQGIWEYILAVQYKNAHQSKEVSLWAKKAKRHLKGTPYAKEIKKRLE